ncbi:MAG: hypothetical protein ACR2JC_05800 [Chloroflexota bacterium]|nr:MAG: hypothetical protein DLM70_10385 [Chloroflexota bacterium]
MRRVVLALVVAVLSVFTTAQLAPAATHAQTVNPIVAVTPSSVMAGATATVSGTGFTPNSYAYVYYQRPDGTYNAFFVNTSPTGTFSFSLGFESAHGTGTEYVSAYDYSSARWAPFAIVTVMSGVPPSLTLMLTATPNPVRVGSSTVISGTSFTPNQYVYVAWQRPDGTTNATYAYTDANGAFSFTLGFEPVHGCGAETVQAYNYGTNAYSRALVVTVNC